MSPLACCTLFWVVGWLLYPYTELPPLLFCLGLFLLAYLCHLKTVRGGFVVCMAALSLWGGHQQARLYDPNFDKTHYVHHAMGKAVGMFIEVQSVRNPTAFGRGFVVEVRQINNQPTSGLALLQLEPSAELPIGGGYVLAGHLQPIAPPKNPGGFDFSKHMQQKGVMAEIHSHSEKLVFIKQKPSLRTWAHQWRSRWIVQIKHLGLSTQTEALLQALVLGERSGIDIEMRTSYADAGAVHLLAISGLHIGILMLLLQWLFGGFSYLPYPLGKQIQTVMVVLCLWGYALLTGLSPSVLRAVTMFSFVALGRLIDRPGMPLQSLWLSLWVLVGLNPRLIYEVGFQLSYAAVAGILWALPKLIERYNPKHFLLGKLWRLWLLGMVAQLSVLPLSLYYFHQFPGLFWVSNLVVVPLLGWILGAGIFGVIIAHWPLMASLWGPILEWILGCMNAVVSWTAGQKQFLFTQIPFDGWDAALAAAIVVVLFLSLQRISLAKVAGFMALTIAWHFSITQTPYPQEEWVVFHSYQKTLIGYKNGQEATFYIPKDQNPNDRIVNDYKLDRQIKKYLTQNLQLGFMWGKTPFVAIDESGIYKLSNCEGAVVLLRDSPKVHLVDLIKTLAPTVIIADGSNYPSFVRMWQKTCADMGVSFHDTASEGAWVSNHSKTGT